MVGFAVAFTFYLLITPVLEASTGLIRELQGLTWNLVPALTLLGGIAGWLVVPHMVALLTSFAPTEDAAIIDAKTYIDFVTKLVIAIGVAFVLPVFLVLLNFTGILTAQAILRGWRIAFLVILGFAAIVTPSADVISMLLLACPLTALYYLAWLVAMLHDRRLATRVL